MEQTVITMIQKQFGVDLQDLIFNGDTATDAEDPNYAFLGIIDGFVKKAKASTNKTDLATTAPTIADFTNHIQVLPEKYKNAHDDITWFITRGTHDRIVSLATQRQTGFGDAVLQEGKLSRLAGYNVEVVANLQSGFAALTPFKNFKPVFTRELRYNRTAQGATAAAKDATYHIIYAYLDAVVREVDAV
ncbi:phage major capsid protein, partial [Pelosinus sp. Bkl1]|nr:phage major capsid protein [Pelosinus baikalensis]